MEQMRNFNIKIICCPVHMGHNASPMPMAILQYYLFWVKYSQENKNHKKNNNNNNNISWEKKKIPNFIPK